MGLFNKCCYHNSLNLWQVSDWFDSSVVKNFFSNLLMPLSGFRFGRSSFDSWNTSLCLFVCQRMANAICLWGNQLKSNLSDSSVAIEIAARIFFSHNHSGWTFNTIVLWLWVETHVQEVGVWIKIKFIHFRGIYCKIAFFIWKDQILTQKRPVWFSIKIDHLPRYRLSLELEQIRG